MRTGNKVRYVSAGLIALALFSANAPAAAALLSRETAIGEALRSGTVKAEVKASDDTSATITLTKLSGTLGKLTVAIPAGTVIANRSRGGQALLTAKPVLVAFDSYIGGRGDSKSVAVETYCLNRFLTPPTLNSALALVIPGESSSGGEETEPVRKLAACLVESSADAPSRQLAVWLVAEKFGERDYGEVRALLTKRLGDRVRADIERKIDTEGYEKLRRATSLPEADVRARIAAYKRERMAGQIEEKAAEEVRAYVEKARPLLDRCGFGTSGMRFFRTAAGS